MIVKALLKTGLYLLPRLNKQANHNMIVVYTETKRNICTGQKYSKPDGSNQLISQHTEKLFRGSLYFLIISHHNTSL